MGAVAHSGRHGLAYRTYPGDRGCLVLLHGVLASHRYFQEALGGRLGGVRLVLPDLLGHGDSARPEGSAYTLEEHLDALADLVEAEGRPGPLFLGAHSLGCLLLTALAARRFEGRVRGLVFLNYPRFSSAQHIHETLRNGSSEYRAASRGLGGLGDEDLVRVSGTMVRQFAAILPGHLRAEADRTDPEALAGTVRHGLFGYRPDDDLDRLARVPMLHLHGGKDRVAPAAFLQARLPSFSQARWVLYGDAGHHLLHTHPGPVLGEIRAFLERLIENGRGQGAETGRSAAAVPDPPGLTRGGTSGP
jgi:pimeloyl-ACP methyl ester carboxylesterase